MFLEPPDLVVYDEVLEVCDTLTGAGEDVPTADLLANLHKLLEPFYQNFDEFSPSMEAMVAEVLELYRRLSQTARFLTEEVEELKQERKALLKERNCLRKTENALSTELQAANDANQQLSEEAERATKKLNAM